MKVMNNSKHVILNTRLTKEDLPFEDSYAVKGVLTVHYGSRVEEKDLEYAANLIAEIEEKEREINES